MESSTGASGFHVARKEYRIASMDDDRALFPAVRAMNATLVHEMVDRSLFA